jgi:hypothetical protein
MAQGETLIEMARRHVAEGEEMVAGQRRLLGRLRRDHHPTELAEGLLAQFEQTLELQRADLSLVENELRQGLRHEDGSLIGPAP